MAESVERELLDAARAGEQHAVDRLLSAIRPQVMRRCQRVLPDRHDAEEACQDALVAVARRLSSFEGRASFDTWLYRVASNAALDTYRRLKRRAEEVDVDDVDLAAVSRTSVIAGNRIDLLDAVEQLDGRVAAPLLMRDVHGLSYDEIASDLDVPVGTVKSRIHEARATLRTILDR